VYKPRVNFTTPLASYLTQLANSQPAAVDSLKADIKILMSMIGKQQKMIDSLMDYIKMAGKLQDKES